MNTKEIEDKLIITNPKYSCPKCGIVEHWIDVSINPYEGKYCQKCCARWINENLPKITLVDKID